MMENAFYFTFKTLFVLEISELLSWVFGHIEKTIWLERYAQFRNFNVTTWLTNDCNTHIAH